MLSVFEYRVARAGRERERLCAHETDQIHGRQVLALPRRPLPAWILREVRKAARVVQQLAERDVVPRWRQCRQPLTDRVRERQLSSSDKLQRHGAAERLADAPHPKPVKAADAHPCLLVGDPLAEHLHGLVASLHHRDRSRWSTGLADQLAERLVEGRVGIGCSGGLGVFVGGRTEQRRCCKNQCSCGGRSRSIYTEHGSIGKMNAFFAEKESNEATYRSGPKMVQEAVDF